MDSKIVSQLMALYIQFYSIVNCAFLISCDSYFAQTYLKTLKKKQREANQKLEKDKAEGHKLQKYVS